MRERKAPASEYLETAFAKLKDELCDGVAIRLANPDKPVVVETDARIHAVVAAILQTREKSSTLLSSTVRHPMLPDANIPP